MTSLPAGTGVELPVLDVEISGTELELPALDVELPATNVERGSLDVELPQSEVKRPELDVELAETDVELRALDEMPFFETRGVRCYNSIIWLYSILTDFASSHILLPMVDRPNSKRKEVMNMSNVLEPTTPIEPEEVIEVIRALRGRMTDFTQVSATETKFLGASVGVDPRAIQSAINAVDASEGLRAVLGKPAGELRQDVELNSRWSAVVEELEAMLKGVRTGLTVRRHRVGLTSLQVYNICRQLARQKEHAHLLPHVTAMRQRFKGGRRQKPVEPPKTEPQPDPLAQSKRR